MTTASRMWRQAWVLFELEWRRWYRERGPELLLRWAGSVHGGRAALYLAALLAVALLLGFLTLTALLLGMSGAASIVVDVMLLIQVLVSSTPLLRPLPHLAASERDFLALFPHAEAPALLGHLLWTHGITWCISLLAFTTLGVTLLLTGRGGATLLLAGSLYQTAGLGVGVLLRLVLEWARCGLDRRVQVPAPGRRAHAHPARPAWGPWIGEILISFLLGRAVVHLALMLSRAGASSVWKTVASEISAPRWARALLVDPPGPVMGLAAAVLVIVAVLLPSLAMRVTRAQRVGEGAAVAAAVWRSVRFRSQPLLLVMQKDLLHFLRVPRSEGSVQSVLVAFFFGGAMVEISRNLLDGTSPWSPVVTALVGSYAVAFLGAEAVKETAGPGGEGERLALYHLTGTRLENVLWAKVLLTFALMTLPVLPTGLLLAWVSGGEATTATTFPAALLVTLLVPFVEALARVGIPASIALADPAADGATKNVRTALLSETVSALYFLSVLSFTGVPAVLSVVKKGSVSIGVAYLGVLAPACVIFWMIHRWWRRRFAPC